jgi:antitoxin component of MazEF toxin-antitoxin module
VNNRINQNNPNNPLRFEVRRIQQQTDGRSYSVVIPNRFSKKMGLSKGDLLKMSLQDSRLLISEKLNLEGVPGNANIRIATETETGGM